jgi:hypothetical protein
VGIRDPSILAQEIKKRIDLFLKNVLKIDSATKQKQKTKITHVEKNF